MSSFLFLTHQALIPLVLVCFVFPQYIPVPTSKFSHSSFFAVSSEFPFHSWWHLPAFASFLTFPFPFLSFLLTHIFCCFLTRCSSTLSHIPPDMFRACSFNGSCYRREVRRHHQNHSTCLCCHRAAWFGDECASAKPHWHEGKEAPALQRRFFPLSQPFKICSISNHGSHYNMGRREYIPQWVWWSEESLIKKQCVD